MIYKQAKVALDSFIVSDCLDGEDDPFGQISLPWLWFIAIWFRKAQTLWWCYTQGKSYYLDTFQQSCTLLRDMTYTSHNSIWLIKEEVTSRHDHRRSTVKIWFCVLYSSCYRQKSPLTVNYCKNMQFLVCNNDQIGPFTDTTMEKSAFFSSNLAPKRERHLVYPF